MSQLSAPVRHPVLACADRVEEAVKDALDTNPTFMTTDAKAEALLRLTGLVDQLETLRLRVIAAAGDVADADGAPTVAAWLAPRARGDHRPAHRAEHLAVALEQRWTLLGEATTGCRVTLAQAEVVARALDNLDTDVSAELLARAEAHLVDQAALFTPHQLRVLGERVLEAICPDTYDDHERAALLDAERRANAATRLTLHTRGDGSVDVRVRIPEAAASRLKTYLEAFTAPRQQDPGTRVPHERRMGQAFCALLEHLDPDTLPAHGGAATRVVVTIDLGRAKRLFTPAQRQALAVRHHACHADGCSVPATWCEAHHRNPWTTGGPTDLANAELLCPYHHQRIHDPDYTHQRLPDGSVRFHRRT